MDCFRIPTVPFEYIFCPFPICLLQCETPGLLFSWCMASLLLWRYKRPYISYCTFIRIYIPACSVFCDVIAMCKKVITGLAVKMNIEHFVNKGTIFQSRAVFHSITVFHLHSIRIRMKSACKGKRNVYSCTRNWILLGVRLGANWSGDAAGRRRGRGAPAAAGDAVTHPSYSKLFIIRCGFIPQQSFVSNKRKII